MKTKGRKSEVGTQKPEKPGSLILIGKMSTFGGPNDTGVGPNEGLALIEPSDLRDPWFARLFLPGAAPGKGLARQLDPAGYYVACRWDYKETSRHFLRGALIHLSANGKTVRARAVDWGPNERTGRIADLSPGAAKALGLKTDDIVEVEIPL